MQTKTASFDNFCNIFDLLTSRTQKRAWWHLVFKPDFYIFSYKEQLRKIYRNFIGKFLSYHTSIRELINFYSPWKHQKTYRDYELINSLQLA